MTRPRARVGAHEPLEGDRQHRRREARARRRPRSARPRCSSSRTVTATRADGVALGVGHQVEQDLLDPIGVGPRPRRPVDVDRRALARAAGPPGWPPRRGRPAAGAGPARRCATGPAPAGRRPADRAAASRRARSRATATTSSWSPGRASASSSSPRRIEIGVRSSWLASSTNRRSWRTDRSTRSSSPLIVDGQVLDLVVAVGHGQPPVELVDRDLLGLLGHPPHRPQRGAGQQPPAAGEQRRSSAGWPPAATSASRSRRVLVAVERRADDEHPWLAAHLDRPGQQPARPPELGHVDLEDLVRRRWWPAGRRVSADCVVAGPGRR